jgi:BirA family biotin operon repressor/biotin-[acetyl-CoA-carboxylase] ligase
MNALMENDTSYLEEYRAHSAVLGKEIRWEREGQVHFGVAEAIDQNGALIVRGEKGEREVLFSGEITVRVMRT